MVNFYIRGGIMDIVRVDGRLNDKNVIGRMVVMSNIFIN